MRALRNCDFCADDAVGVFEIVPPELEPTEAEQRRVVCCSDCSERLETLLEPLLARAGTETSVETDDGTADPLDSTEDGSTADGSVLATADDSTQTRSRTASSNATVSEVAAGGDSTTAEDESDADSGLEEGITFEREGHSADDESTVDADPTAPTGDANGTNDDGSESAPEPDDEDSPSASTRPPATYRKVVRLLRNREFPMTRSAVEELAAGAYDLERHEVEAVVDHAVENGEFLEERGTLRRP